MKKYLSIITIIIIGLLLRLIFIDKPDGLWNDEYVSWQIAATPFFSGFFNAVKSQCHMPFYYLYLKFFMNILGQSDLMLRLTSVFAGILAVPVMYFLGKEKSEETGILCAGMTAVSSFLIYYSQEVRLYSILFLFSALTLLYTLKIIKNPTLKNLILCGLFNFMIIFTHTIGFVFVFFNLIFISVNLFDKFKKAIIGLWLTIFTCAAIVSPLIVKILTTKSFSQWWGHFSISKIGFLFTDYFSPVLTNLTNAPDNFFYMQKLAFFMIVPSLIAIICIIKALIKNKLNQQLFLLAVFFISVLIIASLSGKLVFITKYSIEIYPILIFLACSGLSSFNNKLIKNVFIILYFLISFGYILIHPYSAPKMHRSEGHKIVADILKRMDLKPDDIILLEYYPHNKYEKYFDFSPYRILTINKGNFPEYMSENTDDIYKNGKKLYKAFFKTLKNSHFENLIKKDVFDNINEGQNVVIVILDSVSFYSPQKLYEIAQNDTIYDKEPLLFLVFSYIKNKTFIDLNEVLQLTRLERKGSWTVIKFTKLKKSQ